MKEIPNLIKVMPKRYWQWLLSIVADIFALSFLYHYKKTLSTIFSIFFIVGKSCDGMIICDKSFMLKERGGRVCLYDSESHFPIVIYDKTD